MSLATFVLVAGTNADPPDVDEPAPPATAQHTRTEDRETERLDVEPTEADRTTAGNTGTDPHSAAPPPPLSPETAAATQYDKDQFPTEDVYGNIDHAGLRLITCGGVFDRTNSSYEDNIVIYARLVTSHATPDR